MRTLKILVAEDDDQNQAMMKLILVRQGHRVKSAWNGLAALEAVKSENFDLVFMDVQMPEMDGLEATRQIRRWENNKKHIPIVILTGSVPQTITEEYKNAGADTFILKPFDVKRITLLIELIASESESGSPKEPHKKQAETLTDIPILDMQDALLRFNNDRHFYLDNLSEFIQSLPDRQEKLDQALKTQNWTDLATYAHNLKGVAANFGAKQLSTLASDLDGYCQDRKIRLAGKTIREIHQNIATLAEAANKITEQQRS
jgi:two-component system sensor histidine kinase/response regulator